MNVTGIIKLNDFISIIVCGLIILSGRSNGHVALSQRAVLYVAILVVGFGRLLS